MPRGCRTNCWVPCRAKARALGLWGLQSPCEFGGAGLGVFAQFLVAEEASKCRMGAYFPALGAFGGNPPSVLFKASPELFGALRAAHHRGHHDQACVHRHQRAFREAPTPRAPSAAGRSARVTSTSSTARRCGPAMQAPRTGAWCTCAPAVRESATPSPAWSSTWTRRA